MLRLNINYFLSHEIKQPFTQLYSYVRKQANSIGPPNALKDCENGGGGMLKLNIYIL